METKKKYHFVKVNEVGEPSSKGIWYFKPVSKDDVSEHWNKYVQPEINSGMKEYIGALRAHQENRYFGHYTTMWASMLDQIQKISDKMSPLNAMKQEIDLWYNRMKMFSNGDEIYLSEGMTVFMLTPGFTEIIEDYYSDTLEFPHDKYTLNDVRLIQWDGGKHWYAKLGSIDIVDSEGNQKWNTKAEVEYAVIKYLKENFNN